MGSITPGKGNQAEMYRRLRDAVTREAALGSTLPWDLASLSEQASAGLQEAYNHRDTKSGGDVYEFVVKYLRNEAMAAGKRIRAQRDYAGEKYPPPTDQQVAKAFETFSVQEWRRFIAQFGRGDLDVLRTYLDANKVALIQPPNDRKYWCILEATVTRGMIIHLSWAAKKRRKFVRYLDAFYAVYWRQLARRKNRQGVPHPPGTRWMETVSSGSLAKALSVGGHKVTPKQVAGMFKRWKETPPGSFDGDPSDYWLIITDAHAYNRYRRGLSRGHE